VAALQAAIPVARLSETEGSSNVVGGLEISAGIVISRTGVGLGANCSLLRIDQTCLGRSGGFAPVSLPLFQGSARSLRDRIFRILHGRAPLLQRDDQPVHRLSDPSEVIWRRSATGSVVQEQRPHFGHASSSKFDGNRALAVTPLFAMPAYPTKQACPGHTRFRADPQLALAANEVNDRILRLNISSWSVRWQKIDHSDRPKTTEGHHADHNTDDIGPDQH